MSLFHNTLYEVHHLPLTDTTPKLLTSSIKQPIKVTGAVIETAFLTDLLQQIKAQLIESSVEQPFIEYDSKNEKNVLIEGTINEPLINIDIGIDEVGRGPLYGSVVVAAVILPHKWSGEIEAKPLVQTPLSILTDSKKLSEVKRESLYEPIKSHSLGYVVLEVPSVVIDEINILQATLLGMRLACEHLMCRLIDSIENQRLLNSQTTNDKGLSSGDKHIANESSNFYNDIGHHPPKLNFRMLFDGNAIPNMDYEMLRRKGIGGEQGIQLSAESWVKGDARHTAIAAASVLAKVSRDHQLVADNLLNPGYGLDKHKGYPTKAHVEAINKLGVLPQHRRSFKPVREALILSNNLNL